MIWRYSLPDPRVVEYNVSANAECSTAYLSPYAPALFSVCQRSRYWTLKNYRKVFHPRDKNQCIGYMNFDFDALLLKEVPETTIPESNPDEVDREAARRCDLSVSQALLNTTKTWDGLRFLAISVPVFLATMWSGGGSGPFHRQESSPTLNSIYDLPALQGIAIVSTGAREIQDTACSCTEYVRADFDQRNLWRLLTDNEAGAGWAKLLQEGLVDNYGLRKQGDAEDDDDDAVDEWEEVKQILWTGKGPTIFHVGLETAETRREMEQINRAPRRSERLRRKALLV